MEIQSDEEIYVCVFDGGGSGSGEENEWIKLT